MKIFVHKIVKALFPIVITFATTFVMAKNDIQITLYKAEDLGKFSFPLTLSIDELVETLRVDLGLRVHFEREIHDPDRDILTANEYVKLYGNLPDASLSSWQKNVIKIAKERINTGKGDQSFDMIRRYISLESHDLTDILKLIKKIESTEIYSIKISNGSIIVYPKGVSHENVGRFIVDAHTVGDAMSLLIKMLKERNIYSTLTDVGLYNKKKDVRLNIVNEDFHVFLARFSEAMGPNVAWHIEGFANARNISFIEFNKQ